MASLVVNAELKETATIGPNGRTAITTTGNGIDHRKITVGTLEATHSIDAELTGGAGAGAVFIRNADSTNFVKLGFATGVYYLRIPAGSAWVFYLDPAVDTLYLLADTAACEVEISIREV